MMRSADGHVLLYEMEKGLERSITLLLKQANYRVTCLKSLDVVNDRLAIGESGSRIDILIIDLSPHDHKASGLVRQLLDDHPDLPVVIISPYGTESELDGQLSDRKLVRSISTPFAPEELLDCIGILGGEEQATQTVQ